MTFFPNPNLFCLIRSHAQFQYVCGFRYIANIYSAVGFSLCSRISRGWPVWHHRPLGTSGFLAPLHSTARSNKQILSLSKSLCVCALWQPRSGKKDKQRWYKNTNFGLLAAALRAPPPPPPRLPHCYLLTSPSCVSHYCPRVIKVTGSAFTAKHAEPIRDHSFHSSLKLL